MADNMIAKVLVSEKEIDEIGWRIAAAIDADFGGRQDKRLVLLGILKGSVVFLGDLMRKLKTPHEIEFMKVSSYGASTVSSGNLKITLDLKRDDMTDVDIVVVEDIVDSGRTLCNLKAYLEEKGARSVKICTLLDKPSRREYELVPDYCGVVIPDKFVIGYGLDYNELYRNLPYVGVLKPEVYLNN